MPHPNTPGNGKKRILITDFFSAKKSSKSSEAVKAGNEPEEGKKEHEKGQQRHEKEEGGEKEGTEKDENQKKDDQKKNDQKKDDQKKDDQKKDDQKKDDQKKDENQKKEVLEATEIEAHSNVQRTGDYTDFCIKHKFNKEEWVASLTDEQRTLLALEIRHLHVTWLAFLHGELTKPYFLKLKRFLQAQKGKTVFPPPQDIYSWSHYTPLPEVKCLIMGQDPYHNHNQAHGLAFSVLEPTRPPPSLVNIYKALQMDFPEFEVPEPKQLAKQGRPGGGNLTQWAKRGVLMLNACLTVEAHKANSHAKQGWETFTEQVIKAAVTYHRQQGFVIMAWGSPAQKRVAAFSGLLGDFCVIKSVHPSPLSAHRGFFDAHVFQKCNEWLRRHGRDPIDWGIVPGNSVE